MNNKKCNTQLLSMFLVLVYIYTLKGGNGEVIRCIEKERQALLKFKQELIDEYNVLSSWGSEENKRECCKWSGVLCSNMTGHVISLLLNKFLLDDLGSTIKWLSLSGNLSNALIDLHHLINLDLSHNHITGSLPESVWRLSKLEVLDVSFNSLEGSISESHLSKLRHLKKLGLSYNQLVLNLTTEWIPPFQLKILKLAYCNMGPRFPVWVQTQSEINFLDLSSANISDELPEWFWDSLPRLAFLNLSHNQISGTIPDLSSKLFGYPTLDLSFNEFSGLVPSFHRNTKYLYLSNNKFFGPISFMCKPNVERRRLVLDLSNNELSEQLPDCWENTTLEILDLSNNNFSGKIPHSLCSNGSLFTLHLRNNNLSGELPASLKNCNLVVLDVGGNKLTGNIPAWIGTHLWYSLWILSLRGNNFLGSIPPEICYLRNIQILDLSRNNLSGRIPLRCFNNFYNLVYKSIKVSPIWISEDGTYDSFHSILDNAFVQWKGQEFEYSTTLDLLTLIDLSSNRIEGNIPTEIFQMEGLISLNLSRNHLRGNIDPAVHRMESLECLDVSGNQLSGEIPMGLGTLASLAFLDLSNNNFSGEIPPGTQLRSFNESRYAGNIGLCGPPLPKCPEDGPGPSGDPRKLDDGDENDDELTIQYFLKEFYIAIVLGFIAGFWGIIGTLILKKSWRYAYFQFLDRIKDCLCLEATLCMRRLRVERPHIQT